MERIMLVLGAALALGAMGSASTYTVESTADAGKATLRSAIDQANSHAGPDTIVFRSGLAGAEIMPATQLPTVTDNRTTINGDTNGDGRPDIALNGNSLSSGVGLRVTGDRCRIIGLAINRCPGNGLLLEDADYARIRACHLGVNLAGTRPAYNGESDVRLEQCSRCIIGGTNRRQRNVVAASEWYGIELIHSADNTISGNHIGLTRDGMRPLGEGSYGIRLWGTCHHNTIGGDTADARNLLGGVQTGMELEGGRRNSVVGNFIGLAVDGNTVAEVRTGIWIIGSRNNRIGGPTAAERNAFANASFGVHMSGQATRGNEIQGNYFGTNAAGTQRRSIWRCVFVSAQCGPQVIGGDTPEVGNYFVPCKPGERNEGVVLEGGAGSIVQHNSFGVRPDGIGARGMDVGVNAAVSARITDNVFARAQLVGIEVSGVATTARIFRNNFRGCKCGVGIGAGTRCCLGNLGNSRTTDDGGNRFRPNNVWHIHNNSTSRVKAEGNSFGTTARREINAKIYDKRDNPVVGRVDFSPLMGGVLPTGEPQPALAIAGAAAVPTGNGGAQVTFSLSAPASITATALNVAGRPVRALCRARDCEAGRNTLVWDAQSDDGLAAPNGAYVIELRARPGDGAQVRALIRVLIHR